MQPNAPESPSDQLGIPDDAHLHLYLVDYNPTTLERFTRWAEDLQITPHAYDSGRKFLDDPSWRTESSEQIFILHDGLPEVASLEALNELLPNTGARTQRVWLLSHEFNANLRDVTKLAGVSGWLNRPLGKGTLKMLCRSYRRGDLQTPTPCELIDYHIKTGILSLQWQREELQLSGIMDEKSHFSRIKWLVPTTTMSITMNCSQLVSLNIEGLKEWFQFTKSDWAQERSFRFTASPPMLQELYDAMPELFGEQVALEPPSINRETNDTSGQLEQSTNQMVRTLLLSPALNPEQLGTGFVARYLGCLTTIFRCSLSELYLTREGVLDHSSRLVARCNGIRRGLNHLTTKETFELPERFPLIPALLDLYDPLLASLAAPTKLLQASHRLLSGACNESAYQTWLEGLKSTDNPPSWISNFEQALKESNLGPKQNINFDTPIVGAIFNALEAYLTGPLADIDTIGVSVFQLIKTHTPSADSVEDLANKLRRCKLKSNSLADFRRDTLLSWRPDDSQLTLLARAGAMVRATAHEIQQIVQILDSHDSLQQILGHRLAEIQLTILDGDIDALRNQLQQQAVTLLEKKVIGLYFNELAISFENEVELMGVSLF